MPKRRKPPKGWYSSDVEYYLEPERYKSIKKIMPPNPEEYKRFYGRDYLYLIPDGRPIAYSTKATEGWLRQLKPTCNSWEELMHMVDGTGRFMKDEEAMKVVQAYIDKKSDFNKVRWD